MCVPSRRENDGEKNARKETASGGGGKPWAVQLKRAHLEDGATLGAQAWTRPAGRPLMRADGGSQPWRDQFSVRFREAMLGRVVAGDETVGPWKELGNRGPTRRVSTVCGTPTSWAPRSSPEHLPKIPPGRQRCHLE